MATTPLTVDEISRTILERMTSNHGGSLVEAIEDGAFVVDDQAVAYWVGQAVELARQGIDEPRPTPRRSDTPALSAASRTPTTTSSRSWTTRTSATPAQRSASPAP